MKKAIIAAAVLAATAGVLTVMFGVTAHVSAKSDTGERFERARDAIAQVAKKDHLAVCGEAGTGTARCLSHVVVDGQQSPVSSTLPAGYGPAQFHAAYSASAQTVSRQVIGIVDAYDDPSVLSDLNVYSTTFGIPTLPACSGPVGSSAVPCFQKINQNGGTRYPSVNAGWALEISLDVQAAHAMCQNCSILLVEANSNRFNDLLAAEDQTAKSGATVISNSWGGNEFSGETGVAYDGHFNKPGIAITVSSGDSGYGAQYPASSQYVTAVGGTTLALNTDGSYVAEAAWSGSGSGCSAYETKPSWQTDTGCSRRTVADVSADADPSTGAAVYDSVKYSGQRGWFQVGGTSLASPLIAATYALAGGTYSQSLPYTQGNYATNLHDVLSGSNGSCGGSYLCTAGAGYDGPTGLGTPNGTAAF